MEEELYKDYRDSNILRRMLPPVLWGASFWAAVGLLLIFLFGSSCVGVRHQTGFQKTTDEPLHADSGTGITIWKIPILGIGSWGDFWGQSQPSVVVHRYDYQAQPPALAPGTPPSPPTEEPSIVDYRTVYQESSGSDWGDPTLVVFKNESYRVVRLTIDGQPEIKLAGYQATADIHLSIGEHRVRLVIEKPTAAHGTWEVVRFFPVPIRPEGRSQIFYIYDY